MARNASSSGLWAPGIVFLRRGNRYLLRRKDIEVLPYPWKRIEWIGPGLNHASVHGDHGLVITFPYRPDARRSLPLESLHCFYDLLGIERPSLFYSGEGHLPSEEGGSNLAARPPREKVLVSLVLVIELLDYRRFAGDFILNSYSQVV